MSYKIICGVLIIVIIIIINVSNIPGKHEVKELQKTAILGTAHILRKVKGKGTTDSRLKLTI